jgi:hypothetical protein
MADARCPARLRVRTCADTGSRGGGTCQCARNFAAESSCPLEIRSG